MPKPKGTTVAPDEIQTTSLGTHNNTKNKKTEKIAVTNTKPTVLTLVVELYSSFDLDTIHDLIEQADSLGTILTAEIKNAPSTIRLA